MKMTASRRWILAATTGVIAAFPLASFAEPIVRTLQVKVTFDGEQSWKNDPQFYDASSEQSFEFTTQLKSDGTRHAPNLLHPDTPQRLAIKTEYLRQKGVARLEEAGFDPDSPTLQQDLSRGMQQKSMECKGDIVCMGRLNNNFAMMMAAAVEPDNSALFEGEPRYLYFEPFRGCQNSISASIEIEAEGQTTYGDKEETWPFQQTMKGSTTGSKNEQESLCDFFTVVIDTKDNTMYVENVYFPDVKGEVSRTAFEKTHTETKPIPMAPPLQDWVNQRLRGPAELSGEDETKLSLNLPLDGDSTILGKFTGVGHSTLEWSFQ